MNQRLYFLLARSALHISSGKGEGMIDMPFIREKATGLPVAPGSGVKGVLRNEHQGKDKDYVDDLFGPDYREDANDAGRDSTRAGMLSIDDAFLLCMPVRSMKGTFAWATCPFALHRLQRSLRQANMTAAIDGIDPIQLSIPAPGNIEKIIATSAIIGAGQGGADVGLFEELTLIEDQLPNSADAQKWAQWLTGTAVNDRDWGRILAARFAIVADEVFAFWAETATEVRARIKIESGKAADKMLWYEELMPADSLFWGHWCVSPVREAKLKPADAEKWVNDTTLFLGGNRTVGRGCVDFMRLPKISYSNKLSR